MVTAQRKGYHYEWTKFEVISLLELLSSRAKFLRNIARLIYIHLSLSHPPAACNFIKGTTEGLYSVNFLSLLKSDVQNNLVLCFSARLFNTQGDSVIEIRL